MTEPTAIDRFLDGSPHAVVGASTNREKYGNRVFRCYLQNNRTAYPINPRADEIEGHSCFADLGSLPEPVHGISVITPPAISERVVTTAIERGIKHIWLQPGAEFDGITAVTEEHDVNIIHSGPCLLVVLGYQGD